MLECISLRDSTRAERSADRFLISHDLNLAGSLVQPCVWRRAQANALYCNIPSGTTLKLGIRLPGTIIGITGLFRGKLFQHDGGRAKEFLRSHVRSFLVSEYHPILYGMRSYEPIFSCDRPSTTSRIPRGSKDLSNSRCCDSPLQCTCLVWFKRVTFYRFPSRSFRSHGTRSGLSLQSLEIEHQFQMIKSMLKLECAFVDILYKSVVTTLYPPNVIFSPNCPCASLAPRLVGIIYLDGS